MLDAHQLNVFLIAAETLNFTQAANKLGMSQPSVSQHIKSLERFFSTPLFIRSPRNLKLSDAGSALIPLAREMVKQSIHIEETMSSLQGEVFGHLIVGCSTTPGKYILPHLLTRFHKEHAKVRITCQVSPQTQAIEMLSEGEVNFALTSLIKEKSGVVEFRKFMRDNITLIVPLDHPWAAQKIIQPKALYEVDFLMREQDSGTFSAVNSALSNIGMQTNALNTLMTLGNSEAIALSVQEGLGVGFVSEIVVTMLGQGRVTPIGIEGLEIYREIYIGHNTKQLRTVAQHAFWEFVQNLPYPFPLS
ncbi:MAG: LysR family transcriptional regulator [Chloroflexi bacterium]|nr:LysR family transcriptional regulator [Chloroflexota bacterium]